MSQKKKTGEQLNNHFNKRYKERLGESLPRKEIIKRIKNQEFGEDLSFFEKQSNRVSVYLYIHNGVELLLPYDKQRHKLITVLFKDSSKWKALITKQKDLQEDIINSEL